MFDKTDKIEFKCLFCLKVKQLNYLNLNKEIMDFIIEHEKCNHTFEGYLNDKPLNLFENLENKTNKKYLN